MPSEDTHTGHPRLFFDDSYRAPTCKEGYGDWCRGRSLLTECPLLTACQAIVLLPVTEL